MSQANPIFITEGPTEPRRRRRRRMPWGEYIADGTLIAVALILASIGGGLIADTLEGKAARRCATSLAEITR
jgi:hypothetical protein